MQMGCQKVAGTEMHKCLVGFLALIKLNTLVYNKLKLECSKFVKLSFSIKLAFSKWLNLFFFKNVSSSISH